MSPREPRSTCPIAYALDVVGDRWTLLLIRDIAVFQRHTYKEFEQAGERIPTNILADRLKKLLNHGILAKTLYQEHPKRYRYELTEKGLALRPIMRAMVSWSAQYGDDVVVPKELDTADN